MRRPSQIPLLPLLGVAKDVVAEELHRRLHEAGYGEIRETHGCVFRHISGEGSRLTDLAERAELTKQAVGEVVDDLQEHGYVERAADPQDRRAKIIRLTDRGEEAYEAAMTIFAEIEREWEERYGEEQVAALRTVLEEVVAERQPGLPVALGGAV
jgi:DNA-binding MarR family transcriptional regulator